MLESDLFDIFRKDFKYDEVALSDDSLRRFITKAVNKISEYFPKRGLSFVTTVKDQTRYTVPIANIIKVKEVYYDGIDTSLPVTNFFNSSNMAKQFDSSGMSTFALSSNMEFVKRLETLKRMLPVGAEIVDVDTFDLIPTPSNDGSKVYFEYEYYRTLSEIPMIFQDEMVELIMHYWTEKAYHDKVTKPGQNSYKFDRRGNNRENNDDTPVDMQKVRQDSLKAIEAKIRRKLLKIT